MKSIFQLGHEPKQELMSRFLNHWWHGRSIPASRTGIKEALENMGIDSSKELLEKSYGLSLSDQYWIRPDHSKIQWKDINFFENPFSEDVGSALFGGQFSGDFMSPDNTSDGWLRKKMGDSESKKSAIEIRKWRVTARTN